jgi:RNA polymerase sigma-70 factor (ECF subfamily)
VRHCGDFRGEARIDAWLWSIARNCLMDHFRRARPEVVLDDDELIAAAGAAPEPQRDTGGGLDECVRKAYATFALANADRAEVLARVAFDDWRIEDVAAMLKRSNGATREYLSQCRKKLKTFLEQCREYLDG